VHQKTALILKAFFAGDRLTPILMTSLVTALGLLPLAIGMGDPGREIIKRNFAYLAK
jgi:Cu/Ag efflux pump CusA